MEAHPGAVTGTEVAKEARRDEIKYALARGIELRNFGPMSQQTVALIDLGIHRSDLTIERVLDPAQDVSTEDRLRFRIGSLGPLNAVAPKLAKQIDEPRAVIAEPSAGK
jgi:hypothetical protein